VIPPNHVNAGDPRGDLQPTCNDPANNNTFPPGTEASIKLQETNGPGRSSISTTSNSTVEFNDPSVVVEGGTYQAKITPPNTYVVCDSDTSNTVSVTGGVEPDIAFTVYQTCHLTTV